MAYHELLLSDFREISFLGFFLEREIIANALVYKMLITLLYNKSLFWFITHKISGKGSKNSEYIGRFVLPLRAAAADAQFPFPEEGWPEARVGYLRWPLGRCVNPKLRVFHKEL